MVTQGPSAHAELRQYGRNTRWIVRVCDSGSLAEAGERFAGLSLVETAEGDFVVDDPDYGIVRLRGDGVVEAEGRSIAPKEFTVSGEATLLT
jgi:hypothetical protein